MTKRDDEPPCWARCRVCFEQMFGGQRCYEHNPLPNDDRPHILRNGTASPAAPAVAADDEPAF